MSPGQDASFEPLARSVGPTGWLVAVRKGKREGKTANFVHAQLRPLSTKCNQILHVGLGCRYDHRRQVF